MVNLSLGGGREGVDWRNAHLSRCRASPNKEAVLEERQSGPLPAAPRGKELRVPRKAGT